MGGICGGFGEGGVGGGGLGVFVRCGRGANEAASRKKCASAAVSPVFLILWFKWSVAFASSTCVSCLPSGEILRISSCSCWIALSTWQLAFLLNSSFGICRVMPMEVRGPEVSLARDCRAGALSVLMNRLEERRIGVDVAVMASAMACFVSAWRKAVVT